MDAAVSGSVAGGGVVDEEDGKYLENTAPVAGVRGGEGEGDGDGDGDGEDSILLGCEWWERGGVSPNVVVGMSGQVRASKSSGGTGGGSSSSGWCWW